MDGVEITLSKLDTLEERLKRTNQKFDSLSTDLIAKAVEAISGTSDTSAHISTVGTSRNAVVSS